MISVLRARATRVAALLAVVVAASVGAAGLTSEPANADDPVGTLHAPISGYGSTWSALALQQWARNVYNNYRWTVNYTADGSSAGRQIFSNPNGGADFGVSEIPYHLTNSDSVDPAPSRHFAYMPIVAGGTSFMYNLVIAGKRVTNLRLDGATLTKIFTGAITKWNDPAIAADNPALALPAIPIVPVVRSDGSGTSAQFSAYMRSQYSSLWSAFCVKVGRPANCGITSNYPTPSGSNFIAQSGSDGISAYVTQNQYVGAIGYVEYAYALKAQFPVAKIENAAGYYTEPTAANVAVALLSAQINNDPSSPDYLTEQLAGVYTSADPRTYPMSSYSYMIIPTAVEDGFTLNKGLTLAAFADYFLCEGQQQATVLGYSPLPINLAQAGLAQVLKIPGGDPTNVNIKSCNNPTFSSDGTNALATSAPQPQACDKAGSTQCLTGTGGAKATTVASGGASHAGTSTAGSTAAGSGAGGSTTTSADGSATSGDGTKTAADGSTSVLAGSNSKAVPNLPGSPTTISAVTPIPWYATLAVVAVVAVVLLLVLIPTLAAHAGGRAPPRKRGASVTRLTPRRGRPRGPRRSPLRALRSKKDS